MQHCGLGAAVWMLILGTASGDWRLGATPSCQRGWGGDDEACKSHLSPCKNQQPMAPLPGPSFSEVASEYATVWRGQTYSMQIKSMPTPAPAVCFRPTRLWAPPPPPHVAGTCLSPPCQWAAWFARSQTSTRFECQASAAPPHGQPRLGVAGWLYQGNVPGSMVAGSLQSAWVRDCAFTLCQVGRGKKGFWTGLAAA
jgi:hypothetical protein